MITQTKIDSQDKIDHAIWKAFPQYHTQMLEKTSNQKKTLFRIYTWVIINNNVDNDEQMLLT